MNLVIGLVVRAQLGSHPEDLRQALAVLAELAGDPAGRQLLAGQEAKATLLQVKNVAAVRGEDWGLVERILAGGGAAGSGQPVTIPPAARRAVELDAEAMSLMVEYQRGGRQQHLHDAVAKAEEAARLVPPGHGLVRFRARMNRATIRYIRYLALRDPADLEAALDDARELVAEAPGEGERAVVTATVAACLMQRFRADPVGQEAAMRQAVRDLESVVDQVPSGSVLAPSATSLLADALLARAVVDRSGADADRAVALFQAVADAEPAGAALAVGVDLVLADALSTRAALTGRPDHAEAVTRAMREGCRAGLSSVAPTTFEAAVSWGQLAWDREAWAEAGEAFAIAVRALHRLAGVQLQRGQAETALRRGADLAARATYALVRAGGRKRLEEAVVALETGRALLLSDALERDRFDVDRLAAEGHAELAARYRQTADDLAALERTWLAAPVDAQRAATADGLRTARAAFDEVVERIQALPAYQDFRRPPELAALRAAAGPEPVVYLAATEAGGVGLVARGGGQVGFILPDLTAPAVAARAEEVLGIAAGDPGGLDRFEAVVEWMWNAGMERVVEEVVDDGAAVLVPAGRLGFLPLHAAGARTPFGGWRYALDRVVFRYAPNLRSLATARAAAGVPPTPALVVADPRDDLPAARAEALRALEVFAPDPVSPLVGAEATPAAVRQRLPGHRTLYLACHAVARPKPLDSALQLSGGEITARELLTERLAGVRLAVLSSCESGRIGSELPDEVVALSTGLLQAGAAGVVASLWRVADQSTAVLLSRFLERWRLDGSAPAAALCQAQRDVRGQVHPMRWAAFVYVGA
jgi:hypothetical protein